MRACPLQALESTTTHPYDPHVGCVALFTDALRLVSDCGRITGMRTTPSLFEHPWVSANGCKDSFPLFGAAPCSMLSMADAAASQHVDECLSAADVDVMLSVANREGMQAGRYMTAAAREPRVDIDVDFSYLYAQAI